MRRWLVIALLCLPCFGQSNAFRPSIVQSFQAENFAGGSPTPFQDNVTINNLIVVGFHWQTAPSTTASISDTLSTSFTCSAPFVADAFDLTIEMCYGIAPSSGADSITVSGLTGHHANMVISEFTNVSGTVDVTTTGNGTPFATSVTITPTTTVNGDLLLVYAASGTNNSFQFYGTYPQQLVSGTSGGYASDSMFFVNLGLAGAQSYTQVYNTIASGGPVAKWAVLALAFKPSAIAVTSDALPHGAQGTAYKACLSGVGGAGAYTFAVTGLPGWASLNTSTGCITGTPNANGTTALSATVTDGTLTSSARSLSLGIGSSFGTITPVQNNINSGTFSSNVTSGNVILMQSWGPEQFGSDVYVWSSAGQGAVSDSRGTIFKRIFPITKVPGTGNGAPNELYIGCLTSSGANTVSILGNTPIAVSEWSGAQSVVDDGTNGASAGYPSSPFSVTTANYTAQVANETLIATAAVGKSLPGETAVVNAPFTTLYSGAIGGTSELSLLGYDQVTTATTYTATTTVTAAGQFTGNAVATQLVGLRQEIAGLGCAGTIPPVAIAVPRKKGWVF